MVGSKCELVSISMTSAVNRGTTPVEEGTPGKVAHSQSNEDEGGGTRPAHETSFDTRKAEDPQGQEVKKGPRWSKETVDHLIG